MIVGIVGAGNMGTGIAKAFAMTDGFTVYLCDSNELIANKAKRRIGKELEYSVERGRYTPELAAAMMSRIITGTKYICEEADLVIECIYEDLSVKKETLKQAPKEEAKKNTIKKESKDAGKTAVTAGSERTAKPQGIKKEGKDDAKGSAVKAKTADGKATFKKTPEKKESLKPKTIKKSKDTPKTAASSQSNNH